MSDNRENKTLDFVPAWQKVRAQIHESLQLSKRSLTDLEIIAVSKTRTAQEVEAIYQQTGIQCFGENYVQEALSKQKILNHLPIKWHFIGQVQRNKVRQIVGCFALIHSVDRVALVEEMDRRSQQVGIIQDILLEVNFAGEGSKAGFAPSEVDGVLRVANRWENIRFCGLMVMPPWAEVAESSRTYFRQARIKMEEWRTLLEPGRAVDFRHLSMGTTQDFGVAIQEGASMIRLGTSLFGQRES